MSGRYRREGLLFCCVLQASPCAVDLSTKSAYKVKTLYLSHFQKVLLHFTTLMVLDLCKFYLKSHMVTPTIEVTFLLFSAQVNTLFGSVLVTGISDSMAVNYLLDLKRVTAL